MSEPKIIAVAGPPGSGKSTLCQLAAERLGASVIQFDGFEIATAAEADMLKAWNEADGDFSAFNAPGLPQALADLRAGKPIVEPNSGWRVAPAQTILFEAPLGRRHAPTAAFIDKLVWINLDLDLALARNIRAFADEAADEPGFSAWLAEYLENYLEVVRVTLVRQRELVAPEADMTIDGGRPPKEMAEALSDWLMRRP